MNLITAFLSRLLRAEERSEIASAPFGREIELAVIGNDVSVLDGSCLRHGAGLEQWGQGYHSGVGAPMPIVARSLGPAEIEALTSYLSFVK